MAVKNAMLYERLLKLKARLAGKTLPWPPSLNTCPMCKGDVSFSLAGLFLKDHIEELIDAVRDE